MSLRGLTRPMRQTRLTAPQRTYPRPGVGPMLGPAKTTRPCRNRSRWVVVRGSSSGWWVTKMNWVRGCSPRRSMARNIRRRLRGSRPWQGSSRIKSRGRLIKARASKASLCWLADAAPNGVSARASKRNRRSHSRADCRCRGVTRRCSPKVPNSPESTVSSSVTCRGWWTCTSDDTLVTVSRNSQRLRPSPRRRPRSLTSLA